MKKTIFSLIFCSFLFVMNPLIAMEAQEEDTPWYKSITRQFQASFDSVTRLILPHKCSVCTGETWVVDPNNPLKNGNFTPVPEDVMFGIITQFPHQEICLVSSVSKAMYKFINRPKFWELMDKKNKVHVSKNLCAREQYLENFKYYLKHSSELFEKWGNDVNCSVKNPIFLSFMEKPCESTWEHSFMFDRSRGKFYSFSIGERKFEMYMFSAEEGIPEWIQERQKDLEGETLLMSCHSESFTAHRSMPWECLLREIKKKDETPDAQ